MKIYLLLLFLLCSCSLTYQPLEETVFNVEVSIAQTDSASFILQKRLNSRFNRGVKSNYRYKLLVEKTEITEGFNIGSDRFSNSFKQTMLLDMTLTDAITKKIITKKTFTLTENYIANKNNVLQDYKSKQYVSKNLASKGADQIYSYIQEYFMFYHEL